MTRFEKSKKYRFWITALLLTLFGGAGYAETPTVRAKFSADSVLIGDQFRLEVEVDKDMMEIVEFPMLKQTLGDSTDIEVLGESLVDTLQSDGRRIDPAQGVYVDQLRRGRLSYRKISCTVCRQKYCRYAVVAGRCA